MTLKLKQGTFFFKEAVEIGDFLGHFKVLRFAKPHFLGHI